MRKVSFHTLGCKLNFSESATIARQFDEGGFTRAERGESADICVINSCSVTAEADKKCRNLVRRLVRENPGAIIAITGCYAQLRPEDLASIEGVDLVVGNNNKGELFEKITTLAGKGHANITTCESSEIAEFFAAFSTGDRTRAFLKVQDGCNYRCSYCTIPLARGASRNISISRLVAEAETIAAQGLREIVLTGVNIGDFGRTTGESFEELVKALDRVEGIDRYRISSIEPNLLTDSIIQFCTQSSKFMPHYHIPLQSGCDKILGLMRRRYNTAKFAERIEAVRSISGTPTPFIGIDVIVGFPGESDEDFEQTYNFLERLAPSFLHIFPYSERPTTDAIAMSGKVTPADSAQRVKRLGELSERLHRAYCEQFIGEHASVLFESTRRGGLMFGFTENYIKVSAPYDKSLINKIVRVRMLELDGDTVTAEILSE